MGRVVGQASQRYNSADSAFWQMVGDIDSHSTYKNQMNKGEDSDRRQIEPPMLLSYASVQASLRSTIELRTILRLLASARQRP